MDNAQLINDLQTAEARARRNGFGDDTRHNTVIIENVRAFLWCLQFGSTPAEVVGRADKFLKRLDEMFGAEVQS